MGTKVAVNGLGRIGRSILKLVLEEPAVELVAVNDLVDADNLAYLLRFDTVYGRYDKPVGSTTPIWWSPATSCERCGVATR
jgi:glyceraldehyde 3-phosphate dehydrogenase